MTEQPRPDQIMQTSMGVRASTTLLSAVALGQFRVVGDRSMKAPEVGGRRRGLTIP